MLFTTGNNFELQSIRNISVNGNIEGINFRYSNPKLIESETQ